MSPLHHITRIASIVLSRHHYSFSLSLPLWNLMVQTINYWKNSVWYEECVKLYWWVCFDGTSDNLVKNDKHIHTHTIFFFFLTVVLYQVRVFPIVFFCSYSSWKFMCVISPHKLSCIFIDSRETKKSDYIFLHILSVLSSSLYILFCNQSQII